MKTRPATRFLIKGLVAITMGLSGLAMTSAALAQSAATGASGLPLPRFVSLKAKRVNLRIGPSRDYAVQWLYTRSGIPMEIIQEYDHWRRVRDHDGTEGWIHKSLLTGERTAAVAPWKRGRSGIFVQLRNRPQSSGKLLASLEPGVIVNISECNGQWCEAEAQGVTGWVAQDEIWGAYPGEAFR